MKDKDDFICIDNDFAYKKCMKQCDFCKEMESFRPESEK